MTLTELTEALAAAPADAPLIFEAPTVRSAPGYHVTELKLAEVSAIDCGGRQDSWREATLQILDGQGGAHMPVGKFLSIARRSAAAMDGLGAHPLRVEFAAGNARLELFEPQAPRLEEGAVVIPLGAQRATCKPAASLCCGAGAGSEGRPTRP
jgi:hypothetical protein